MATQNLSGKEGIRLCEKRCRTIKPQSFVTGGPLRADHDQSPGFAGGVLARLYRGKLDHYQESLDSSTPADRDNGIAGLYPRAMAAVTEGNHGNVEAVAVWQSETIRLDVLHHLFIEAGLDPKELRTYREIQ